MFLSYACAVGWVIHVFHDEGGGVELAQPVAIRTAEFCVICTRSIRVFVVFGFQEGCAYETMGLMYCLYT